MFEAYRRANDHTNAITYGRKLLTIYRECDEIVQEGELSVKLAEMYQSQSKYAEAKELYERAIPVMQKTFPKQYFLAVLLLFMLMTANVLESLTRLVILNCFNRTWIVCISGVFGIS